MSTIAPEMSGELAQAPRQMLDALVGGDRASLEQLVAGDCQVIGPKGFMIGKDEWIETHSAGIYQQILLEVEQSQVTTYDGLAVRCDLQRSECLFHGENISGLFYERGQYVALHGALCHWMTTVFAFWKPYFSNAEIPPSAAPGTGAPAAH
jgi:hypothetical protein